MAQDRPILIGMLFAQFAAYHVDRCEAVARRLGVRAQVRAVEVATTSSLYAWEPSGDVPGTEKITLFPGQSFDAVGRFRRAKAIWNALHKCDHVLMGIGYNEPDVIAVSWLLRITGVKVVLLTESKADDFQRDSLRELFKALVLLPYVAAIVGGARQASYLRSLVSVRARGVISGGD